MYDKTWGTELIVLLAELKKDCPVPKEEIERDLRGMIVTTLDCDVHRIIFVPSTCIMKSTSGKISRTLSRDKAVEMGLL